MLLAVELSLVHGGVGIVLCIYILLTFSVGRKGKEDVRGSN